MKLLLQRNGKNTLRLLIALTWAMTGAPLQAQEMPPFVMAADTTADVTKLTDDEFWERVITIEYPVNRTAINPQDAGYQRLMEEVRTAWRGGEYTLCHRLVIRGSASPDGNYRSNEWTLKYSSERSDVTAHEV